MAPKLRILLSSGKAYPPTLDVTVNCETPTRISTELFDGEVSVFVRGFGGENCAGDGSCYFDAKDRGDMTYGLIVKGRYLDNPSADDVLFGNIFEYAIRESLPWGTSIATKFMTFIDPTLELDVYANKPWALSPAVATMNHLSIRRNAGADEANSLSADMAAPPAVTHIITEDALSAVPSSLGADRTKTHDITARRRFFGRQEHRNFPLEGEVGMEFSSGILDFTTLSVKLPRPFSLSVPLLKYWDGQPVTYMCRRRVKAGENPATADGVYWAIAFEIVDEDAIAALKARGGRPRSVIPADKIRKATPPPVSQEATVSDDDID